MIRWQTSSAVDGITGISTFNYKVQSVPTENILLNAEQDKISGKMKNSKFQILSKNFQLMISLHDLTTCAGSTDMINIPEIHTLMQIYSESLKRLLLFL